jgi:hypothetical protein
MTNFRHSARRRRSRSGPLAGGLAVLFFLVFVPLALAAGLGTRSTADTKPTNTTPPTIVGALREGQALRADPGDWQGTQPMHITYQWSDCGTTGSGSTCSPIQNANDRLYVPMTPGRTLMVTVTATNSAGSTDASSTVSAPIAFARTGAPVPTARPTISGQLAVGSVLTAHREAWNGMHPLAFHYRWRLCSADGGACTWLGSTTANPHLKLGADAAGHTLRVLVTAHNSVDRSYSLSLPTDAVRSAAKPVNTAKPTIGGTPQAGDTLYGHPGDWLGNPNAYRFSWLRCDDHGNACHSIDKGQNHVLVSDDVGHRMRLAVWAFNHAGSTRAVSDATSVVAAKPAPQGPQATSRPTISGTAEAGQVLKASTGTWNGATPMDFFYQWARCDTQGQNCSAVTGSLTTSTYTVAPADVGHRLIVQVKAHNGQGDGFANSQPTDVIKAAPQQKQPSNSSVVSIGQVSLPDRLVVDKVQFVPNKVTSRSAPLTLRVHVSEISNGKAVSGAIVQGMAVPFNRLSSEPEVPTGSDGWATLTYRVLPNFQLKKGNLVVMFVRARKPGENVLAGVSTRRLISVRVG